MNRGPDDDEEDDQMADEAHIDGADADDDEIPIQDGEKSSVVQVPKNMKHLPTHLPVLAKFVRSYVDDQNTLAPGQDASDLRTFFGAVYDGCPANPAKPTTCAYRVADLPKPNLGTLPRDEIFNELKADRLKLVKQRRDVALPNAQAAFSLQLAKH